LVEVIQGPFWPKNFHLDEFFDVGIFRSVATMFFLLMMSGKVCAQTAPTWNFFVDDDFILNGKGKYFQLEDGLQMNR